jgi:FAD/FMN-containing dehydrogenase
MLNTIATTTLLLLVARLAGAAPSPAAIEACKEIRKELKEEGLAVAEENLYRQEVKDYYNSGLAELKPACVALPRSAEDAVHVVKVLNRFNDVHFAVKSGGHSPNAGHASVKDGVLISLSNLEGTSLDLAKKEAHIKPGGHWWDVMKTLEGTGHTVVGGRLGVVGIGGYLLQGGVSFLSGQYGLGADVSIIEA